MVRAAVTAVVAALAVLLTPMPATPPRPLRVAAAGFFTFGGGSALEGTGAVADFGRGYDVRVDPAAPHAAGIADAVEYAVAQLQKYGIEARYRGIGTAPASASSYGRITVGEATDAAQDDCLHATSADSGAVTEGVALPSFQDVGIAVRVNSAQVTFCPPVWSHDQHYVTAIALHELGHAVGLGHYPSTYRGAVQVMNPIVPDVSTYQAGDVNGLRYLVAQTARLRAASVLDGAVESWTVSRAGLATTGWAIVGTTVPVRRHRGHPRRRGGLQHHHGRAASRHLGTLRRPLAELGFRRLARADGRRARTVTACARRPVGPGAGQAPRLSRPVLPAAGDPSAPARTGAHGSGRRGGRRALRVVGRRGRGGGRPRARRARRRGAAARTR